MAAARLLFLTLLCAATTLLADTVIPPKPAGYFNDYAGVVSRPAALKFNEELAQYERDTSNQIVVAVYRKMQSDSDIADYTQRVAQAWGVGRKEKNNGAVLLVFIDDRKMYIATGYGAEGALPDVTAFDITERHIKPLFKQNDYEGGLAVGIELMEKALRGEYKGTGKTVLESTQTHVSGGGIPCLFFFLFVVFLILMTRLARGKKRGWGYSGAGGPFIGGWSSGSSSGGWSSGSSGGGGFSGFSGGGGSFGGGGGGSSW